MNKAELKEKWGKYCDTDKLCDDVRKLLNENGHRNSEQGVCALLDKYFTNKEPLIKLFTTSNHYAGDMRIITKQPFDRQPSRNEIYSFFNKTNQFHETEIIQNADDQGKTMHDYLATGKKKVALADLPKADAQKSKMELLHKFDYDSAATLESFEKFNSFLRYLNTFKRIPYSKLQRDLRDDSYKGAPHLKAGTKTSRAFNKVCQHYGVDKFCPETKVVNGVQKTVYPYDRVFAEYSDLVSDLSRQMYFVISLNPLDYLQMSYGISWNSCHRINGGQWQGGCLSYMLDNVSMVSFVIDKLDAPVHEKPRYYRQMFHYNDNMFMQNRLYPKENDGATDLYSKFRNFVIEEFAELLDESGEWQTKKGECREHVNSTGLHYVDYNYNPNCTIFFPSSHAASIPGKTMTVGHNGICVHCGKAFDMNYRLNHNSCIPR